MKTIRSVKHQLSSYEINKVPLLCFHDKQYILENRINSLTYGPKPKNKEQFKLIGSNNLFQYLKKSLFLTKLCLCWSFQSQFLTLKVDLKAKVPYDHIARGLKRENRTLEQSWQKCFVLLRGPINVFGFGKLCSCYRC